MPSNRSVFLLPFSVVVLAFFSPGCADDPATAPMASLTPAAKPTDSGPGANYERRYLPKAIDASELILEMAQVCMEKPDLHPELMTFCEATGAQASHDVSLLQGWLSTWYGIDHTPSLSGPDQRVLNQLRSVNGADFETAYLNAMVKEYTTMVRGEQHCYARASTTALIGFCFDMQLMQSNDIDQMKSWLCAWYGECR